MTANQGFQSAGNDTVIYGEPADPSPTETTGPIPAVIDQEPSEKENPSKHSAPKTVRVTHEPKLPVPNQGPRKWFWKLIGQYLYRRFGWNFLLKRSTSEIYNSAYDALWNMRRTRKIVAVLNSKGGAGKTPLSVWLTAMLATVLKRHMIALDANENAGHTADGFGIPQREDVDYLQQHSSQDLSFLFGTIQLRQFLDGVERDRFSTFGALNNEVDWDPESGVTVIGSDRASNVWFSREKFEKGLRVCHQAAHSTFCDTGNGLVSPANLGSANLADTLTIAAIAANKRHSKDSLNDVTTTRNRYRDMGFKNKVENSIAVVLDDKVRRRSMYAEMFNMPIEQVFVVPSNRYMRMGKPARPSKLNRRMQAILLEILVAIMSAPVFSDEVGLDLSEFDLRPEPAAVSATGTSVDNAVVALHGSSYPPYTRGGISS